MSIQTLNPFMPGGLLCPYKFDYQVNISIKKCLVCIFIIFIVFEGEISFCRRQIV